MIIITKFTYYVVNVHMYLVVANPETRITESDSGDLAGLLNFN